MIYLLYNEDLTADRTGARLPAWLDFTCGNWQLLPPVAFQSGLIVGATLIKTIRSLSFFTTNTTGQKVGLFTYLVYKEDMKADRNGARQPAWLTHWVTSRPSFSQETSCQVA